MLKNTAYIHNFYFELFYATSNHVVVPGKAEYLSKRHEFIYFKDINNNDFKIKTHEFVDYLLENYASKFWKIKKIIHENKLFVFLFVKQNILIEAIKNNCINTMDVKIISKMLTPDINTDLKSYNIPNKEEIVDLDYQHSDLDIKLYNYQLKTVKWMTDIEKNCLNDSLFDDNNLFKFESSISLKNLIFKNNDDNNNPNINVYNEYIINNDINDDKMKKSNALDNYYYDDLNYELTEKPVKHSFVSKGAILADEMGLGKTLECVSLILINNKIPENKKTGIYFNTKATLILCPNHLINQWEEEILKYSKKIKCVKIGTILHRNKLSIKDILESDIVLVSLNYVINKIVLNNLYGNTCSMSYIYSSFDTYKEKIDAKLTTINSMEIEDQILQKNIMLEYFNWQRVMIDEGHELFLNKTMEKKLLRKIIENQKSNFVWLISGTPFIDPKDFNKVMRLLNFNAYINYKNNKKKVNYDTLKNDFRVVSIEDSILKKLYYRNTKKSIANELNMPSIIENNVLLTLTNIEKSIYDYYVEHCYSITKLQQLCCHPNIINDCEKLGVSNILTSLEDIKTSMIQKLNNEIETCKNKMQNMNINDMTKYYEGVIKKNEYLIGMYTNVTEIENKKNEECSICLNQFTNMIITDCGHFFCKTCIMKSINLKKKCPQCRQDLNCNNIHPVQVIETDIKGNAHFNSYTKKYGTKLGKLVSLCKQTMINKNNKIIIFSQWENILASIGKILSENEISNVCCKGSIYSKSNAINKFKKDEDCSCILLSLENSASGTNLENANYIIFLDIPNGTKEESTAIENQAICRSLRQGNIGKLKCVNVIRLIIQDTIEEELYKRNNSDSKYIEVKEESNIEDLIMKK